MATATATDNTTKGMGEVIAGLRKTLVKLNADLAKSDDATEKQRLVTSRTAIKEAITKLESVVL